MPSLTGTDGRYKADGSGCRNRRVAEIVVDQSIPR